MAKSVHRVEARHDELSFELIYGPEFLTIHYAAGGDVEGFLVFHPNDAMKLMLELRYALRDYHTEDTGDAN